MSEQSNVQVARSPQKSPLHGEEYRTAPHKVIARLRAEDPFHFVDGGGFWFATRYEDVRRLFTDPNVTTDRRVWNAYVPPPPGPLERWAPERVFAGVEHLRMRRLVTACFTPRAVSRMGESVRAVVQQIAEPLRGAKGIVDIMSEFTDPIPNAVVSRIIGLQPKSGEEVRFRALAQVAVRGMFDLFDHEAVRHGQFAYIEIAERVRALAEERRREPQEDMLSVFARATDEGRASSDDDIITMVVFLLGAGSETTAWGGLASIVTLLDHPEVVERLRADRSLIPKAVSEVLRYALGELNSGVPRYALHDCELFGKQVKKGQLIVLSTIGAHRDPSVFPDPDRFDIDRDNSAITLFGHGAHHCIGMHLARTEMAAMIDAALDFLPAGASHRRDLVEWNHDGLFRRPLAWPVDFGA